MRSISYIRRKAGRDARLALKREKVYARELRKAISAQMIQFGKNESMGSQSDKVINELYDKELPYWLVSEYDNLGVTVKADSPYLKDWNKWVKDFKATNVAEHITSVNDTTKDIVRTIIKDGADKGLQFEVISENILASAKSIDTYKRALTIARTEMGNAINAAKERSSEDFALETGVELGKLWIHRSSSNPRQSHIDADNGIPIPKNVPFIVDGEEMMYPHDPFASAGNVINCSCQVVYTRLN